MEKSSVFGSLKSESFSGKMVKVHIEKPMQKWLMSLQNYVFFDTPFLIIILFMILLILCVNQ